MCWGSTSLEMVSAFYTQSLGCHPLHCITGRGGYTPVIPALKRRQKDQKFKITLGYSRSSTFPRTTTATRLCFPKDRIHVSLSFPGPPHSSPLNPGGTPVAGNQPSQLIILYLIFNLCLISAFCGKLHPLSYVTSEATKSDI